MKEKDASLGGVGRGINDRIPDDASSDAPNIFLGGVQPAKAHHTIPHQIYLI